LAWTKVLLDMRSAFPDVFSKGTYRPLAVEGPDRDHVVAYAREHEEIAVIVAVGRHFADLTERGRLWPRGAFNATLDTSAYAVDTSSDVIRTNKLPVAMLMANLPAAVLTARRLSPER
jgi:(1->4)-alpha-D-glucan 1-alpha-D-glucosylmutase